MRTFFLYLLYAPLWSIFFGFLAWLILAMLFRGTELFRGTAARRRISPYGFLRAGYAILAIAGLFLFTVGTRTSSRVEGPDGVHFVTGSRDHQVAPLLGTAVSFAIVWLVRREWLRRRGGPRGFDED
ncbi:hypothetical protein [Frankia sp. Cppng1_Ct_nod]|uniref:hypothetical protein n=1 Tax=Frankia sp. Cppng1_Ct_nod TaxID=2897162 RepID=UPI0010413BD5|nr:hypothetical protein [Frankia sp. Cppng1_Ct_nod]